jgi:hypothetical protein
MEPSHAVEHHRALNNISQRETTMPGSAIHQYLQDSVDSAKAALARAKFTDNTVAPQADDQLRVLRARVTAEVVPLVPLPNGKAPESGASALEMAGVGAQEHVSGFRTFVAANIVQRERAFRLAYRMYRDCGYVADSEDGRIVSKFDADPRTLVLLVQDSAGRDAATVSLVFDSPAGLPCDEVHGGELAPLRAQGRRLAEVTRLAIDLEYAGSKALLVQLFNFMSVYGRHVERVTDCMIQVNPRHVNYYRRLLMFEPAGPERACPRVNGARAKLLRLDGAAQVAEIRSVGGTRGNARGSRGRTLYSQFCALDQEPRMAACMRSQHRPMTAAERRYFQLDGAETRPAQVAAGAAGRMMATSAIKLIPAHEFNYFENDRKLKAAAIRAEAPRAHMQELARA